MNNPFQQDSLKSKLTPERGILILLLILQLYNLTDRWFYQIQLKDIPSVDLEIGQQKFCTWAVQRMIESKTVKESLTSDIFYIFKNKANPLGLSTEDKITTVKAFNDNCRVIVDGDTGQRAFILNLVKNDSNPLYYKIDNISSEVIHTVSQNEKEGAE